LIIFETGPFNGKESEFEKKLLLNSVFLKNRISELGIKQWWLAEQIGVDRKTVIRWLQGQVKSIQIENAGKLCQVLDCTIEEISLQNEADQLATPEDQKAAAQLLLTSSLIDKLGPIGEWNVIESLLKASMIPNLPLNILGELYDKLTIASWRQSKIDQAALYNTKAEEIARQTKDQTLLASALLSKANIFSWRGEIPKSIQTYQRCLELRKFIEPRTLGSIYSNLGGVFYESGDLKQGEEMIRLSLESFELGGSPVNLSISHTHLALIALLKNELAEAEHEAMTAIQYAIRGDFKRGIAEGALLKGEIAARTNQPELAVQQMNKGLQEFSALGIEEGLNYEIAGRTCRYLKDFKQAETYLRKGIQSSQNFPLSLASLHVELALVLRETGSHVWQAEALRAVDLFQRCECRQKLRQVAEIFQISV
jgi:DNA-binding Xre family transcriptional regulator